MTTLELAPQKTPLKMDIDGVFRVGETRVRLDTVIGAFENGCLPEEILFKYPSLSLSDIYAVIAYYMRNRSEVETYLSERRVQIQEAEFEVELRFPSAGVRERLLSRQSSKS